MANPTPPTPTPTSNNLFQQTPTLTQIQQKVRRLTRTPSTAQMSDAEINNYINTFLTYDFPEILRTFNLRTSFTFYTNPGQDVYNTDELSFAGAVNNPLYNFQNLYISVHDPVYIAGFQSYFVESPQRFYGIYPNVNSIQLITTGTGGTAFSGVINTNQAIVPPGATQSISLLQSNVVFNAVGTSGAGFNVGMALQDVPVVDTVTGYKTQYGNLYDVNSAAYQAALVTPPTVANLGPLLPGTGVINYLTGVYNLEFPYNTVPGTDINSLAVGQNIALPQCVLYYSNTFTLRPVPDASYPVNFEVFQRPVALLMGSQAPELEEYWQYIAYGASKKIFEDRMDLDSVQLIMPEFRRQETLCLRRTLVQNANQRTSTIYTEQTTNNGNNGSWGNGWGAF